MAPVSIPAQSVSCESYIRHQTRMDASSQISIAVDAYPGRIERIKTAVDAKLGVDAGKQEGRGKR